MGRSRNVQSSADDDLSQRSKRKRASSSTGGDFESASSGQGASEVKRALYHCNYCNKDISGQIRIKCAICPDFDLCVECFSVGAEVTPHKSNHPYRVMDNLSFPLTCPDWNADEEILLLEGIEMYGVENWADVAEHVATKSKAQCIHHYTDVYMNSPSFPLPDLSHVVGKNREELLAMAKEQGDGKKGFPTLGDLTLKEDSLPSPPRVRPEEAAVGQPPCILTHPDVDSGVSCGSSFAAPTGAVKKAAQSAQVKDAPDSTKVEDSQPDRSFGVKKPKSSREEGPSMFEMSGYNPKRQEFDPEYDNDAEQLLADMEFNDTDTEEERELKLRVLHIYNKRLDERKRRKDFIIERNLVQPDPLEKDFTPEEREIYDRYKVFMRFQTKEEHDELIKTVLDEHRIKKRIQDLQDARDAGCRTSAEAERFIELKRKREAEEPACKGKEAAPVGPSSKPLPRMDRATGSSSPRGSGGKGKETSTTTAQASPTSLDVWDVTGLPGADLLSAKEKRLCEDIQLLPSQYLKMQEDISVGIFTGNVSKKSDAHRLFQVDPSKIDRVYDMLVRKGIAPPSTL